MTVIQKYEIKTTFISAIVTDTEPTMNSFGRLMHQQHGIAWIGCVDHILELCTAKAFDDCNYQSNVGCMKATRQLVGTFRHSNQKMDDLKRLQEQSQGYAVDDTSKGPLTPLVPIDDCTTRWWSTYSMLERLVSLKKFFRIMEDLESIDNNLSDDQWKVAEDLVHVLRPFMLVQNFLREKNM